MSVLGGLRSTFCRYLSHHRSCGGELGTSSFPTLVEDLDLGKTKVDEYNHPKLDSRLRYPKMDDYNHPLLDDKIYSIQKWMTRIIQSAWVCLFH